MRHNGIFHAAAAAAIVIAASITPASATRCLYPADTAKGADRPSMTSAWKAAIGSWERTVAKKHGRRYANWYYAGDGKVDCTWNAGGDQIRCRATAVACAD